MTKRNISAKVLFSLSLFLLFNANINLIDPLPDFIAYVLMIVALGTASEIVPYLAECKNALALLALVSAMRIPAFFIMYGNLTTGRDIVPMFTLIFVALECILLYKAIENGYRALCYISERTDASMIAEPFSIGRDNLRMTLTSLKMLTYIFFAARQVLNLLPELMLLTTKDTELRRQLQEAYPTVLVICILAATVIGIVWIVCAGKYVKHIGATNEITAAISSIEHKGSPEEERRQSRVKSLLLSLNVLALASVFSFDLTFSNFGEINILPHFIYGIAVFGAIFNLITDNKKRVILSSLTFAFVLSSVMTHLLTTRFLEKYEYLTLLYFSEAKRAYVSVEAAAVIEAIILLAFLSICAISFAKFIIGNTGTSPSDETHGTLAKKSHKALITKGCVLFSLMGIITVLKCLDVFLKGKVQLVFTDSNPEGFAAGSLPWMPTVIFAICVIYVLYSFYFINDVKEEVKFKYGIEK